jgi:hypothetical protein
MFIKTVSGLVSYGAGHMPEAFYDQEQPGYPQSPPGTGGG